MIKIIWSVISREEKKEKISESERSARSVQVRLDGVRHGDGAPLYKARTSV